MTLLGNTSSIGSKNSPARCYANRYPTLLLTETLTGSRLEAVYKLGDLRQ
ncbi:hypothetical protein [Nostoc sp. 106C]|nr:hypothetical protein [Nostoc sp. 106C]